MEKILHNYRRLKIFKKCHITKEIERDKPPRREFLCLNSTKITPLRFSPHFWRSLKREMLERLSNIALLIIDMQEGLFVAETPRYDSEGVSNRINTIGNAVREAGGIVVFIQHDGSKGSPFEPGTEGWQLLSSLSRNSRDIVVNKTACDSFYKTDLKLVLDKNKIKRLIIAGCATDFCVDTTIRAAFSLDYQIIVVADGHTTSDRPNIDAASLIQHHNWLWGELINPNMQIEVMKTDKIVAQVCAASGLEEIKGPTNGST